jgi:hypothetical protein
MAVPVPGEAARGSAENFGRPARSRLPASHGEPPRPSRFRTIALFGDFARAIKHMRFLSRTRESPHFRASTRLIVKHIFGTSRGDDDGAELAAAEALLVS